VVHHARTADAAYAVTTDPLLPRYQDQVISVASSVHRVPDRAVQFAALLIGGDQQVRTTPFAAANLLYFPHVLLVFGGGLALMCTPVSAVHKMYQRARPRQAATVTVVCSAHASIGEC
jgi:predicted benzoate:H+ symporter BenE